MQRKNIVTKKTYMKDGVEKAVWNTVGTLSIADDGKMFVELFMSPDVKFYVFDPKPREGSSDLPQF